jgi:hypothetical protein
MVLVGPASRVVISQARSDSWHTAEATAIAPLVVLLMIIIEWKDGISQVDSAPQACRAKPEAGVLRRVVCA